MINVILATHGLVCNEMKNSLDMITGTSEGVHTVPLIQGQAPETYRADLESKLNEIDNGNGVVVLSDIKSGTPYNSAMMLTRKFNLLVVSGVNMSMLTGMVYELEDVTLEDIENLLSDEDFVGVSTYKTTNLEVV